MMVEFDVADNVTIFMVLVVTTVLFLIALIWAKCKDSRDIDEQKPHWMKDNLVEDHYFYEVTLLFKNTISLALSGGSSNWEHAQSRDGVEGADDLNW